MAAAMLLVACEKRSWKEVARLPREFRVGAALALGPNLGLVGGRFLARNGNVPVIKAAAIFRVHGERVERVFSRPKADVFSLASRAGVHWALLRIRAPADNEARRVALLSSTDGGSNWQEVGPVPAHASQLLATSRSELWVLGVDSLLHTADGGTTWTQLEAPGERNPIEERLALIDEGHVGIIGKDGILLLARGSAQFDRRILPGHWVMAADGRFVVVRHEGRSRVGEVSENLDGVRWLGTIRKEAAPFDLVVSGRRMWLLALPENDPLPLRGVFLFTSNDGGRSWSSSRVRSAAWYDDVDVGPDGAGIGVGYENEVWLADE